MIQVPFNFKPLPHQLKFFQAMDGIQGRPETRKRRALLRWHRRAGKDKASWCYLVKEAATVPGNYFYIFPTAAQGRKSLWENVDGAGFRTLNHLPDKLVKRLSNQEMMIELTNGSTIRIVGLDVNEDAIRGVSCKGVVFSEFAYQNPDAYKVLMPALREAKGWAVFNSTPCGRNHFYEMESRVKDSPDWYVSSMQVLYPNQPNYSGMLTQKEVEQDQIELGYTDEEMQQEYGVSYTAVFKGAIYQDLIEKARSENRVNSFPYLDHAYVDTYWDLGMNDYTVIWFRQMIGSKIIWIDYYENRQQPLSHYVDVLKEKGYRYRTHHLPHDGAQRSLQTGLSSTQALTELCKHAKISNDVVEVQRTNRQEGINGVRSRFPRFYFNSDSPEIREALEKLALYHRKWDPIRKILLKDPVHDHTSHCADGIRTEACSENGMFDLYEDNTTPTVIKDYDLFD